jgi:hypothetical protein
MTSRATRRSGGLRRRGLASVLAAAVSTLLLVTAAPASATSGGAISWGYNGDEFGRGSGQLGDGNMLNTDVPVTVLGLSDVTAVSAGGFTSLALLGDGTVMAWGQAAFLGNGSTANSNVPVKVSGLSGVKAISAGYGQMLALLENGTVMDWGDESELPAAKSGLSGVTAVSAGEFYSLALLGNGTLMEWPLSGTPMAVSGLSGVTAISANADASLALLKNGTVMQWLGSSAPAPVSGLTSVTAVAAGWQDNLAIRSDGTVMEWSGSGPVKAVSGLSNVAAVSVGRFHNVALISDGTIMAWDDNMMGQLGNNSTTSSSTPVLVSGPHAAAGISAGYEHNLAYGPPLPTVTHVDPNIGPAAGDTAVTITGPSGTDFTETSAVKFGSIAAASFSVNSATSITAVAPEGVGVVDVAVTTPSGTSPPNAGAEFNYSRAGLPEFGRCLKATGVKEAGKVVYHGDYENGGCTKPSPTKAGKYNWAPGPGTAGRFTGVAAVPLSGPAVILESTRNKHQTTCQAETDAGEITGPKTETVNVTLTGCESGPSVPCQSDGAAAGEIRTYALEGEIGLIKGGEKPTAGIDLKPTGAAAPFLASYECANFSGHILVQGSVIGQIMALNAMNVKHTLTFSQTKGVQKPERFEAGLKETLTIGASLVEQSGLKMKEAIASEERIEIRAIP